MPKMKTHRGAAKRFKVTGTGKLKRFKAFKSHILTKKSQKRKRNFRQLWITRINAGTRQYGLSYPQFMHGLKLSNIDINRKMLSEIAIKDPAGFEALVKTSKQALGK